jgi:hypothetical protein
MDPIPIDFNKYLGPQIIGLPDDLQFITFNQIIASLNRDGILTRLLQWVPFHRLPANIYEYIRQNHPYLLQQPTMPQMIPQMNLVQSPFGGPPLGGLMGIPVPQNYPQAHPQRFNPAQYMLPQAGPFQAQQQLPAQQFAGPQPILGGPFVMRPPPPEIIFSEGNPKYPIPNGREIVKDVLTDDWIYRNRKGWPLVPLSDFDYFRNSFGPINYDSSDDLLMVPTYQDQWPTRNLMRGLMQGLGQPPPIEESNSYKFYLKELNYNITDFSINFYDKFPHIKPLLEKYKGKLAVCGGAVTRTLLSGHHDKTDVDLFFYKSSKEEAFAILLDCVATLVANYKGGRAIIERKLYVTNVILESVDTSSTVYQFIHRIYPTLDSILGGFDIGCSAVGFDGEKVYGTPLGVYSITKKCLIVDTTRRSTSFEHRILKYARAGFAIIFPGITIGKANKIRMPSNDKDLYQKGRKVNLIIRKLGLYFSEDFQSYNDILGSGNSDIFLDQLKVTQDTVKTRKRIITDYETTPEDMLRRFTDYGADEDYRWKHKTMSNGTVLRANNIEAVSVFVIFPREKESEAGGLTLFKHFPEHYSYDDVIAAFIDIISNPQLKFDETYKGRAFAYIAKKQKRIDAGSDYVNRLSTEVRLFAEMAPKMRTLQADLKSSQALPVLQQIQKEKMDEMVLIVDLLNDRMKANLAKAKDRLTGMQWIDQEPGRQWTSSINPVVKKPEDFYGEYYVPFGLGIPCKIETTLRLMRKFRKGSFFAELPGDLFKLLLIYILRAYTYNTPRKPNAWEPLGVQITERPTIVEQPATYFSELAVANGGDLKPKGKIEKREEEKRLHSMIPAAQIMGLRAFQPSQNPIIPGQQAPSSSSIMQTLMDRVRQKHQENQQENQDSDSDDDESEEPNTSPIVTPNIKMPSVPFSHSPYKINYDMRPTPILEKNLPRHLIIIGLNLYLDEDTKIVYSSSGRHDWMIVGRIN